MKNQSLFLQSEPNCNVFHPNREDKTLNVGVKLFSFDNQCKKVKNSKRLRKKMREVIDLGEKMEDFVYPVEQWLNYSNAELG